MNSGNSNQGKIKIKIKKTEVYEINHQCPNIIIFSTGHILLILLNLPFLPNLLNSKIFTEFTI